MWQELIDVLSKLCTTYEGLAKLGERKRGALVGIDMKALSQVLDEEQIIAAKIQNLERRRGAILTELSNSSATKIIYGRAEEFYHNAPTLALERRLIYLHKLLSRNVERAVEIRDNNQILAKGVLKAVQFHLNRLSNAAVEPTYGKTGANVSHEKKFDFQA